MNKSVKDRTIEFVKYKGITMKSFELKCGLSTGYVTSMRKGFGIDKLNNVLTAFPELNRDWLLYGEGEMLKESKFIPHKVDSGVADKAVESFVPLLPIYAYGGSLNDFATSVNEYDCEKVISPIVGVDFSIQVSGDSMAPEYPNGSRIFIKKINERAFIEWGKTYVLDTCNGTVVKRIIPSEREGYIRCVSINPDPVYAPFEVALADVFGMYKVMLCMSIK